MVAAEIKSRDVLTCCQITLLGKHCQPSTAIPVIAYNEKSRIWSDNEAYSKVFKDDTSAAHIILCFPAARN